jgi:hypothetical protein
VNPFGDLARPITQRPGDKRDAMSYGDAMALRDRARSGQPVDKEKLAEADAIVRATRDRVGYVETKEDKADPVCVISAAPGSMSEQYIKEAIAVQAEQHKTESPATMADEYPSYEPRPGSLAWKVIKHLTAYPNLKLSRSSIAKGFSCFEGGVDGQLGTAVARGVLLKARNSKMELTWQRGPSKNVVMGKWDGAYVDPDTTPEEAAKIPPTNANGFTVPTFLQKPAATPAPTAKPAPAPTPAPTLAPTPAPTSTPTPAPTEAPIAAEAKEPSPMFLDSELSTEHLAERIKPNLWASQWERSKRWRTFFDAFKEGDYIDLDDYEVAELTGWMAWYDEIRQEYPDGGPIFGLFEKSGSEFRLVRIL